MFTREQVLQEIENSPGFPKFTEDDLELLNLFHDNASMDMDGVIAFVERNSDLSETLLASVNSPLMRRANPTLNVRDAVVTLGIESVCNIALQKMILKFFPARPLPGQTFDISIFWRHLTAVALMAGRIGILLNKDDLFRLFSYGILHDLGHIVIDACLPDKMDEIEAKAMTGMHHLVAEKTTLSGLTHTDIGAWICDKWGLGDSLRAIVANHHSAELCQQGDDDLKIIYVSEILGGRYYEKYRGVVPQDIEIDQTILHQLGLAEKKVRALEHTLPKRVDKFVQPYLSTYEEHRK